MIGPVLFIVYHYDLTESLATIHWKHLFADDLSILFAPDSSLSSSNMIKDITEQIVKVLNRLIDYSKYWKQPINYSKTYWMLFNRQVAPQLPEIVCQVTILIMLKDLNTWAPSSTRNFHSTSISITSNQKLTRILKFSNVYHRLG